MTSYNFGDVVLVPFPFTDQTTNKKRPAVVISSDVYNAEYPDRILMAITSQVRSSPKVGDIIIADWRSAGLLKASMIKPVITTIEKQHDPQKIGKASRCRYPVSERGIDWNYR
ncbi:type II toxin-antitoxin system PemK/MazF family toxin [Microcoleus sp.]|uniref:type II toxin-antitoxin system PemK/MazF family toxin n=1 Tax=Microcoleus sp. TaxID=44472 RepID=UPI0035267EC4